MKKILFIVCLAFLTAAAQAQNMGLSFSYFIPRHGSFSTPISPFSIRGIGYNFNNYVGIQTGATLYRMSGLNLVDLPFTSNKNLLGPNFTLFVPAELTFTLKGSKVEFEIKGGGFFFYGFSQHL